VGFVSEWGRRWGGPALTHHLGARAPKAVSMQSLWPRGILWACCTARSALGFI
jgi:hypothetical protein